MTTILKYASDHLYVIATKYFDTTTPYFLGLSRPRSCRTLTSSPFHRHKPLNGGVLAYGVRTMVSVFHQTDLRA
ncbi:hypothetical protein L1887_00564 [Cichorium endivia]|nr:hypothetical protein L1887_00564 [Cichorium endivia]